MNFREVQFSSRSVIPVALALPINREPSDIQAQTEMMRRQREAATDDQARGDGRMVTFSL
jgi:hypothetical protein